MQSHMLLLQIDKQAIAIYLYKFEIHKKHELHITTETNWHDTIGDTCITWKENDRKKGRPTLLNVCQRRR